MKGTRGFGTGCHGPGGPLDLGSIFDEIFKAAKDFHDEIRKNFQGEAYDAEGEGNRTGGDRTEARRPWIFDENTDYYPNYSYPPMNAFMTADRSLTFEFALAGFDEKDISLSFQGDYMVFSAVIPPDEYHPDESVRYFKRRLKMKDIERQKYFVPLDKYAQDKVKAVFRNGILRVSIPPKEEPDQSEGIKIEIVTEDQ
jgi:HSP20 family molecular chaperone IbpA